MEKEYEEINEYLEVYRREKKHSSDASKFIISCKLLISASESFVVARDCQWFRILGLLEEILTKEKNDPVTKALELINKIEVEGIEEIKEKAMIDKQ